MVSLIYIILALIALALAASLFIYYLSRYLSLPRPIPSS